MDHLLSIQSLCGNDMEQLVNLGAQLKATRKNSPQSLAGQQWALIFTKSSTRTRVSFEVGIRELGGSAMFLSGADIQLGRGEPIKDTARVMGRMIHGAIIRTFDQQDVDDFAAYSGIPTINALTDDEHPCQILADLLTIQERLGAWQDKRVVFLGDGDCNVARSWIWAAVHGGFDIVIGAPAAFQPSPAFLATLPSMERVTITDHPVAAVKDADAVYTDVWVSMGKEQEAAERIEILCPWQLNHSLMQHAKPGALVMHCLPAYREKEITAELMEAHAKTIFDQAENRLHAQKAVLVELAKSHQAKAEA